MRSRCTGGRLPYVGSVQHGMDTKATRKKREAVSRPQLLVHIGLLSLGCSALIAQKASPDPTSLFEDRGGKLQLILAQESAGPHFRLSLHNVGSSDLILNLGTMLGNGQRQYANRVFLLLTGPNGKQLHLEMIGPGHIAGRMDPLVVPLPVDATIVLPISLDNYWAPKDNVWNLDLIPGRYVLSVNFTGVGVPKEDTNLDMKGISLMPYWIGSVDSNQVIFMIDREIRFPPPYGESRK